MPGRELAQPELYGALGDIQGDFGTCIMEPPSAMTEGASSWWGRMGMVAKECCWPCLSGWCGSGGWWW